MVVDTTKSYKHSLLCHIPLVRGDYGGVWLCWYPSKCRDGSAIGFVGISLSVDVIVFGLALCLSLYCEVDLVWLSALPLV